MQRDDIKLDSLAKDQKIEDYQFDSHQSFKIYRSDAAQKICESCEKQNTNRQAFMGYFYLFFASFIGIYLLAKLINHGMKWASAKTIPNINKNQPIKNDHPKTLNSTLQSQHKLANIHFLTNTSCNNDDFTDLTITGFDVQITPHEKESSSAEKLLPKKNWRISTATPPVLHDAEPTIPSTAIINNQMKVYAINRGGKQIGTLSIEPRLLEDLNNEEKNTLKQICSRGLVLEGSSAGKKGLIFKDKKFKLKDCTKDYRFWAQHLEGGKSNHFVVNEFKPSHKGKEIRRYSK